ncbi:hypothetical protein ALQ30_00286 [Pseudomonas syringae pv. persicae]|uniref:Uncharacterized protein n=2 Tax=Pseudomonas syringae group TaxID=136849 RepID=A0A3M4A6D6_9PSED|nr:hypothetical protein ALQ30_00286 [Pseudomonas syringae pv. persicae]
MLDSVVKERVVKSFRLNRGAHSTASLVSVKRLFQEVFKVSFATSTTCASINSAVAHQREANSTALQPRVKLFFLTAVDHC